MKVWVLVRRRMCEDTGYLLGHLTALFAEVVVGTVGNPPRYFFF